MDLTTRALARMQQPHENSTPESASDTRRRREAFARQLCARICDERRTFDELRVVDDVLVGLEMGAEKVGPLDLTNDDRDWDEEAAQECRDLLAYLAMDKVARAHRKRERIACEAHDVAVAEVDPGLAELRDAEVVTSEQPLIDHLFDHGGEG